MPLQFFFLFTTGLTVLYYIQHQEIQTLAEQNVVVHSRDSGTSLITLPDGTLVHLNTNSSLTYQQNFGQDNRKVKLSGEGYFEVKKDAKKKFIVNTEYMDVTVLGTKFNLYAYEDKKHRRNGLGRRTCQCIHYIPPLPDSLH